MKQVYILWHHYPDDPEDDNAKLLGVYSSEENARRRIEKYKLLPGFTRGEGAFTIDAYEIDVDHWNEGYFKTGEGLDHE